MRSMLTETRASSKLAHSPDWPSPNNHFASAGVKVAIIATDAVCKGLAQINTVCGGGSPWVTEVFETEEEARAWLAR